MHARTALALLALTADCLLISACSAGEDACSIANDCADRNGMAASEAIHGSGTKMCGHLGEQATFLHGDGTTTVSVHWFSSDEACSCNVENDVLTNCNGQAIDKTQIVCVWEEGRCLPGLCAGCTAGPYGSCPPSAGSYASYCSQDSVSTCRSRAAAGKKMDPQGSALYYTRNLRIEYGMTRCDDYRAGKRGSSEEVVCDGDCE